jgi:hypothetical protein
MMCSNLLFLQFIYVIVLNCIVLLYILADAMVSTGLAALGYKYINLGTQQLCLYYHAYSLFYFFYKTIYILDMVYLVFFFLQNRVYQLIITYKFLAKLTYLILLLKKFEILD